MVCCGSWNPFPRSLILARFPLLYFTNCIKNLQKIFKSFGNVLHIKSLFPCSPLSSGGCFSSHDGTQKPSGFWNTSATCLRVNISLSFFGFPC
jgi:hypothetical protein